MTERTNEAWLRDPAEGSPNRDAALEALRARLQRSLFYYLGRERSDLADRTPEELQQMAEDFAQEALLRILANLDRSVAIANSPPGRTKIAVRLVVSELRRLRYRDFSPDSLVDDENRGADTSALASAGADGLSAALRSARSAAH